MTRYFSIILKLLTEIFISGVLTLMLVMFTPSIFGKALHLWIDSIRPMNLRRACAKQPTFVTW